LSDGEVQHIDEQDSSSSSSDTDSSQEPRSSYPRKSDFQRLVSAIFSHVRSLYKISVLLRRPSIQNKFIRSVSKDQNVSYFAHWDKVHIAEKMYQWALGQGHRYEEPIDIRNPLVSRLGGANTRRREQLKYWQKHPDQPTSINVTAQPAAIKPAPQIQPSKEIPSVPEDVERHTAAPSKDTKQSFSTVAESVLNDNETYTGRPKTIYEPSTNGVSHSLRVPDAPRPSPGNPTFDCPYCFTRLDTKTMQQRQLWK
jgi:hypothetical protein